jgi:hypothetical protein
MIFLELQPPSVSSFVAGGLIMLAGVVIPLGYMYLKNRSPRAAHSN